MPKSTLIEYSILELGDEYFVEKTMSITRYKFRAMHGHQEEVQEMSKDLNQQMIELEAVVAILINLDSSNKEGLSLDKLREKWRGRFEEIMQKGDGGENLLLDQFMDIWEEVRTARKELIKLKEMQRLVFVEFERIKFESDWLDGLDLDTFQQVSSSFDKYILEHSMQK